MAVIVNACGFVLFIENNSAILFYFIEQDGGEEVK
jgi:hypothetical protein